MRNPKYQYYTEYVAELFANESKKQFREFLIHAASENRWIKHFQSIYTKREQEGRTGWIDFESEISFIIQLLDEANWSGGIDTDGTWCATTHYIQTAAKCCGNIVYSV